MISTRVRGNTDVRESREASAFERGPGGNNAPRGEGMSEGDRVGAKEAAEMEGIKGEHKEENREMFLFC